MKLIIDKKRLEKYMDEFGWDEKELAKQIGVSYVQVYRVLRGQRHPGNEFLAGLKKACIGVPLDSLVIIQD